MKKYFFFFFGFFIFSFMFVSAAAPLDFTMRVASVNDTNASVYLSGWTTSTLGTGQSYKIIRKWGSQRINMNIGTTSGKLDTNVPLQDIQYELQRIDGLGNVLESKTKTIKLTPKPGSIFQGVGWGASNEMGIGWISISSESQEPGLQGSHSPSVPYGVFADTDGEMHGAMWAGHESRSGKLGYGWLSFNADDVVGCPGSDRNCTPRISGNGQISGWARFINAKENDSSWDGFVQLRGTAGGKPFGLCLGDAGGIQIKIGGVKISSGETCNQTDGEDNRKLSGLAWAGDTVGGWIVFSGSSGGIGVSSSTTPLVVIPAGRQNIAIREQRNFQANHDVAWFVDNTIGGNLTYGRINPSTPKNMDATYAAPLTIPNPDTTILKASSTDNSTTPPGIETRDIKILPPYSLACFRQGATIMQLVVTKNYSNSNYSSLNPHQMNLYGDTNLDPTTVIYSQLNGQLTSFLHTGLSPNITYRYKLETKYTNDNYSHFTSVINCNTGVGTPTSGGPANLNAYAYDKNTIVINWKDNSQRTDSYDFEIQRIKVTPATTTSLTVIASGTDKAFIQWENRTVSTPYSQQILKSSNGGSLWTMVADGFSWASTSTPPSGPISYTFLETGVGGGSYLYKIRTCSLIDLTGLYSNPIAGGSLKPTQVCVDSSPFSYIQNITENKFIYRFTASFFQGVQGIFNRVINGTISGLKKSQNIIQNTTEKISSLFSQNDDAKAAGALTPFIYYAYFQDYAVTTNPSYKDNTLDSDTVYLYRVAISNISTSTQIWSNLRAAKTLRDSGTMRIGNTNRPICMRNSFCDTAFPAWRNNNSESSEQQCETNRDCVNVGRSDQGFEER